MDSSHEGRLMVAVGAVIEYMEDETILLLKRTEKADFAPGIWEIITGRMQQFEELEVALKREILEEAGLNDIEMVKPVNASHFYRGERSATDELVLIIYWCKTTSKDVTLSGEHTEYQWVTPQEALHVVEHPGVRNDLEAFIREKRLSMLSIDNSSGSAMI